MYISDEDYAQGIEYVREKTDTFLKKQAEFVDQVISLQEDSANNFQQIIEDLQSKSRFLRGMEALQVQQSLLLAEGLMVIHNQLSTMIKLLQNLSEVSVDTNVMVNYLEINTNLIEENTGIIEQNARQIERNTS